MKLSKLTIRKLGPVTNLELDIHDFTILSGPQASGKSTVAKAVFFCRTLKNEIFSQLTMPLETNTYRVSLIKGLEKRLRRKFLGIFGSTWAMPMDMEIKYEYQKDVEIRFFLEKDRNDENNRNFVEFELSDKIKEFISSNEKADYQDAEMRSRLHSGLMELFNDPYDSIYIPAGRGMITLLTDQLASIFSSITDGIPLSVDYCTRGYVELILRLKPYMANGLRGLLNDQLHLTQERVNRKQMEQLIGYSETVLKGEYRYVSGEERLVLGEDDFFVKINYASSGQQETAWIFNILFYYALMHRRVCMIIEEPEAHLYPEAQRQVANTLALFSNLENQVVVTTHSPYILGQFNNLLYASRADKEDIKNNNIINEDQVLQPQDVTAYHLNNGSTMNAMEDGLILNELIDGAAEKINEEGSHHSRIL